MATPSYAQIEQFQGIEKRLLEAAIDEFSEMIGEFETADEVLEEAIRIAEKYRYYGAELGAQWYDLCSELAGVDVEAATVGEQDYNAIAERAAKAAKKATTVTTENALPVFQSWLTAEIENAIRETGYENLWRDYERGLVPGKWARVPGPNACAFCLVLASQGAWYYSRQTAKFTSRGEKYHANCSCTPVYHADSESIRGYRELDWYKSMYYHADNLRISGKYSEEVKRRIDMAKEEHDRKYDDGLLDEPWQTLNETLILMRSEYGLK